MRVFSLFLILKNKIHFYKHPIEYHSLIVSIFLLLFFFSILSSSFYQHSTLVLADVNSPSFEESVGFINDKLSKRSINEMTRKAEEALAFIVFLFLLVFLSLLFSKSYVYIKKYFVYY